MGNGKPGNGKLGNRKIRQPFFGGVGKVGNGKMVKVNWAMVIRVTENWALRIALVRCI